MFIPAEDDRLDGDGEKENAFDIVFRRLDPDVKLAVRNKCNRLSDILRIEENWIQVIADIDILSQGDNPIQDLIVQMITAPYGPVCSLAIPMDPMFIDAFERQLKKGTYALYDKTASRQSALNLAMATERPEDAIDVFHGMVCLIEVKKAIFRILQDVAGSRQGDTNE